MHRRLGFGVLRDFRAANAGTGGPIWVQLAPRFFGYNLFNTPPKGSQYIILAHQYITALLNIQGGSSVPPAVQTALNTAAAYFAGGGAGAGDPNVNISGVSTILDNYNNGLTGPGHCN